MAPTGVQVNIAWDGPGVTPRLVYPAGIRLRCMNRAWRAPGGYISQILNLERADVLAAQDALDKARTAITQRRYADASHLLDRAQVLISRVRDPKAAQRLRAE